jgi:ABC-type anion transport system duplicated permease subunit|tara:strand:+ start:6340 stop:6747 length:408 start_codon:yes stop_codon:yes gene_type:complete
MTLALVFGFVSFFALLIITFVKLINVIGLGFEKKPKYAGELALIVFALGLFAWFIFFISSFASLNAIETHTQTIGADIITTTIGNNDYETYFSFVIVANVMLILILLMTFIEFMYFIHEKAKIRFDRKSISRIRR